MIKQVLAGAALATGATMAVAAPASAQAPVPQALNLPANTLTSVFSTGAAQGPTTGGTGAFGTSNGDTTITGGSGGILNGHGASQGTVDLRCAVPLPEGEGIGGHGLSTIKNQCNLGPTTLYQAPQKLL
ncbi:hypothetical protein [Streptomyces sp. HUAS TT7]|uniref:hypothetical protein n=1 Tax=Streptomyces sp. HUAS TT7 TaxID=3447507 RepID=UPI003F6577BD